MDKYIIQEVEREIKRWSGVTGYWIDRAKKHPRIYLETLKGTRFVVFALTASDRLVAKNIARDIRKELRALGAEKE